MAVENVFHELQINAHDIELGSVVLDEKLTATQHTQLDEKLTSIGFQIIDDRKSQLIERIKNIIVEDVHHTSEQRNTNLSQHLSAELHQDYNYLSSLFSEVTGTTIEKYHIAQKIERVKELLSYNQLTLSQIAWEMGYSSVAHLSNQFKKVTGFTPSHFKGITGQQRRPLDEV
jgi:YesN/AraC family two-component response regulator